MPGEGTGKGKRVGWELDPWTLGPFPRMWTLPLPGHRCPFQNVEPEGGFHRATGDLTDRAIGSSPDYARTVGRS